MNHVANDHYCYVLMAAAIPVLYQLASLLIPKQYCISWPVIMTNSNNQCFIATATYQIAMQLLNIFSDLLLITIAVVFSYQQVSLTGKTGLQRFNNTSNWNMEGKHIKNLFLLKQVLDIEEHLGSALPMTKQKTERYY